MQQSTLDDGSASTALTSVADDPAVRARTQERLRKGLLPAARPRRIWAGQEADELCSVCDMVIGFGDILCEWLVDDGHQARMYPMCYDAFIAGMESHCAA